jgi:serine/threonine-protein kinase HipA
MEYKCLYCYKPIEPGHDFHRKCSIEFFGKQVPPRLAYTLDQMDELARYVVERSVAVPGVQAKLSMSLIKDAVTNSGSRLTVMNALNGQYIFKPPSDRFQEMPENEHLSMRMAEAFGIRVVPSSLIRLASGERAYISRRIDRTASGGKIHMLDMLQITEAFDKYKSSMEKVGKALKLYSSRTQLDLIFFLELALFSFLTGNNDMHLKNFSMIESPSGWVFAPAYDLLNVSILNPDDPEELALTLAGKKKKLRRAHFEQLGAVLNLTPKQIEGAFRRMSINRPTAISWIDNSFLSAPAKLAYKKVVEDRYQQLGF